MTKRDRIQSLDHLPPDEVMATLRWFVGALFGGIFVAVVCFGLAIWLSL